MLLSSSVELRRHPAYRDRSYGGIWGDELVALPKGMREGAMDFGKKENEVKVEVSWIGGLLIYRRRRL